MTLSEIVRQRLINQQISASRFKNATDLVAWLGAVQAQEYHQAIWGLGLRLPHVKEHQVKNDIEEARIIRTHLLRPTWHFVAAEDLRWMLMLTAPRIKMAASYMHRKLELEKKLFNRCNNILAKSLQGHAQLTRNEIKEEFGKKKIVIDSTRLGHIMMQAELDGIVCSGARKGNQFTYALLEERVPPFAKKTKEEALAELTRRYFMSRGPATLKDYSTWSRLTMADCKNGLAMIRNQFSQQKSGPDTYYFHSLKTVDKKQFHAIHLLPIYDEFLMGYKDRNAIMEFRNKLKPGQALRLDNTIIYEGQIIGYWKRIINAKSIDMEYEFLKPLNKKQDFLFRKALERYSEFSGLPVKI